MIHYIYIASIIIITIFVAIYYIMKNNDFNDEMQKIAVLESIQRKKDEELEKLRSYTIPCPYGIYEDPRTCYVGSDRRCTWNIKTSRCEQKE